MTICLELPSRIRLIDTDSVNLSLVQWPFGYYLETKGSMMQKLIPGQQTIHTQNINIIQYTRACKTAKFGEFHRDQMRSEMKPVIVP